MKQRNFYCQNQKRRSEVMSRTNRILAQNKGLSFGDAQRLSWESQRALEAMRTAIILITFTNAKGETMIRPATLLPEYMGLRATRTTPKKKKTSPKVGYYDLLRDGFRSFLPTRFVGFEVEECDSLKKIA